MGFFSRIKKLWTGETTPPEPAPVLNTPGETPLGPSAPDTARLPETAPIQPPVNAPEPQPTTSASRSNATASPPDEVMPEQPEATSAAAALQTAADQPENILPEDETAPLEEQTCATNAPLTNTTGATEHTDLREQTRDAQAADDAPSVDEHPSADPDLEPEHDCANTPAAPDSTEPADALPQTAPATAAAPRAVHAAPPREEADTETPIAPKASGWRKFFGLAPKPAPQQTSLEPAAPRAEIYVQEKPTAVSLEPWQQRLVSALRDAEPKLSVWMIYLLDGVDRRGESLWNRLRFLFAQLDVPAAESEDFIQRFASWLEDMDYDHVDEFRSELQYRMALALDLEDEEDERNRLFLKLSAGLGKTREQLTMRIDQLLSLSGSYDDEFWDELEEILLMADVGLPASQELFKRLKPKLRKAQARDALEFKALLKEELAGVFHEPPKPSIAHMPEVVLMVGVNGAGKTTTIAKLAHRAQMQGRKVLVAAGDTFRAAAIEQLQVWSKRVGAGFYAKAHGSDPAAVAFEAIEHAIKEGYDLVFVDTAGRLQTKHNLMEELKKINRVMGKKLEGAPHRTILVLDATTGQNALSQVKLFSQASPIDEIVLTKLDGTAKGGIIVAIALEFNIPISFIGLGEKMEDLRPFSGQEFANALFA